MRRKRRKEKNKYKKVDDILGKSSEVEDGGFDLEYARQRRCNKKDPVDVIEFTAAYSNVDGTVTSEKDSGDYFVVDVVCEN